ncbi:MAG: sigma 54-interacting transcriptional regulator [Bacteroidales bacterium]|nr:sigma 54-interacting transcriptional regulator [Bacteroidales bacterium]
MANAYPVFKDNEVIAVFSIAKNIKKTKQLLCKILDLQDQLALSRKRDELNNGTRYTLDDIVGESDSIVTTVEQAKKAALNNFPVLLYGETGTGKELFAQGIHNASLFSKNPFVAINCAAIPESLLESILFGSEKGAFTGAQERKGLFEQAEKGTLFLDEINAMPLNLQGKILRAIQEKSIRRVGATQEIPICCRIISSTNQNSWECARKETLREDLLYRLAVICIDIPPLRNRERDILDLANFFLNKYTVLLGAKDVSLSRGLETLLLGYSWPGNVRELEHFIQGTIALLDFKESEKTVCRHHVPINLIERFEAQDIARSNDNITLSDVLLKTEKRVILNALERFDWNITLAAEEVGIGRQNMQYRIKKLEITKPESHA